MMMKEIVSKTPITPMDMAIFSPMETVSPEKNVVILDSVNISELRKSKMFNI